MKNCRVAFIGHQDEPLTLAQAERLKRALSALFLEYDHVDFFIGREGAFDETAKSTVDALKKEGKRCALHLVLPAPKKGDEEYKREYDSLFYPKIDFVLSRRTTRKRDKWFVDNCDLVVCYLKKRSGCAYQMTRYAKKKGVNVFYLNETEAEL